MEGPAAPVLDNSTESELSATAATPTPAEPLVLEELLVEEISIDGMCGVY